MTSPHVLVWDLCGCDMWLFNYDPYRQLSCHYSNVGPFTVVNVDAFRQVGFRLEL
jgi:hypothetical protein